MTLISPRTVNTTGGGATNPQGTTLISNTDGASGHEAHVSHFGALKAASTIPVISGNFAGNSLNQKIWTALPQNGGSVVVANNMAELSTGTNSAGDIALRSKEKGKFVAGQVTVWQSGVFAGVGVANNVRAWGMRTADLQDGLYFKWSGTTFQVVSLKAGVETAVDSTSFNGENDWTPTNANTTYRIEYSAGRSVFYRTGGGKKVMLHQMVDTQEPLVNDLNMGVFYENRNTGNTTDVSMFIRGSSISIWGEYKLMNRAGAQVVSDFGDIVALNSIPGFDVQTKFGRNPVVNTATTPEDLWNGGDIYTGFNATQNENVEVFSDDVNDTGSLVSSGTSTGGSATTLIDTGATFVTDGVVAGDLLINDSQRSHGFITAVTETQITVHVMNNGTNRELINVPSDTYRVATATSTGASVMLLSSLLNFDYEEQNREYVILDGTTGVIVTGDYMRGSRGKVVAAGSSGNNEGTLTVRQETTTANVFMQLPENIGQTTIGCFTVPKGKKLLLKRIRIAITRANGSAGSATVLLNVREAGGAWNAIRVFEISTSQVEEFSQTGGYVIQECSDIKFTITFVSDNSSIFDGAFEYFLIDN